LTGGGVVRVAAAVLLRGDGVVLLAQRPAGKAYAGYWEFPGGKLEPGENPGEALTRELREELGIRVRRASPWFIQEFVYPHAHVELHFFRCELLGEPRPVLEQEMQWVRRDDLATLEFPPADAELIKILGQA
jgi:8-oxo-dGTP diphosphatase